MNEPYAVISTHTLTWSVTHGTLVQRQISNFNSHAHVERDAYVLEKDKFDNISTHTLTWSVTGAGAILTSVSRFQLTRSRGA